MQTWYFDHRLRSYILTSEEKIAKTDNNKKQHVLKKLDLYQKNVIPLLQELVQPSNTIPFYKKKTCIRTLNGFLHVLLILEKHIACSTAKVLPADHPFWQENFPGNLWNCKCDWTHTDEPVTSFPQANVKPHTGLEGIQLLQVRFSQRKQPGLKEGKEGIWQAEKEIRNHYIDVAKKAILEIK